MSSGVTSMAAEIEDLKAEIKRLLAGIRRNNIIEECAKVADEWQRSVSAKPVGEAIRALKDKP